MKYTSSRNEEIYDKNNQKPMAQSQQPSLRRILPYLIPAKQEITPVVNYIATESFPKKKVIPEQYKKDIEYVPKDTYNHLKKHEKFMKVGRGSNYGLKLATELTGIKNTSTDNSSNNMTGTLSRQKKMKVLALSDIEKEINFSGDEKKKEDIQRLRFMLHTEKEEYDKRLQETVQFYKSLQKSTNGQIMLFNLFQEKLKSALNVLQNITNPKRLVYNQKQIKVYPKELTNEIPPLAVNIMDQGQFNDYIGILTHTEFTYKSSSKSHGIIPNILRLLMNSKNSTTKDFRNTEAYNDTIYFFKKKGDLSTCLEYFEQMSKEGIKRNTKTYNIIISLISNIQNKGLYTRPGLDRVLPLLKNMKSNNVCADLSTWSLVYSILFDNHSKQYFLKRMHELNIPVSNRMTYYIIKERYDESKVDDILDFLISTKAPFDQHNLYIVLRKVLDNDDFQSVFLILNYMKHYSSESGKIIDSNIMNIILSKFAELGRVDLAVMSLHTLRSDFKISSDTDTLKLLYKAVAKRGMHKLYHYSFDYIDGLCYSLNGKKTAHGYWRTKCLSLLKVDCTNEKKKNLGNILATTTKNEMNKKLRLINMGMGFSQFLWSKQNAHLFGFLRVLGSSPRSPKNTTSKKGHTELGNQSLSSKRREKYMKNIRYIGLQKELSKRVKYLKNGAYEGLKSDILERDLLIMNEE